MAYNANKHEQDVLKHWDDVDAFKKSVEQRSEKDPYVFYDGPPFATGLPHYGHLVASVMKDAIPRFWTMNGKRVERVWGWDCHGLPIENIVEKELGTKSKKDIEEMGVEKFNNLCRSKVDAYAEEWEKVIHRFGRWVDMDNAYWTMDKDYMESVWWVFKQLWDKDLVYKGYKPMHICPRCETTLSQQEVSEGYKDVKDLSVTAQFKITNPEKINLTGDVYALAWTTTPWTLPGNVLLAVGNELDYVIVKFEDAHYILAKDLLMANFEGKEFEVIENKKGSELVDLEYVPLFPYFADSEKSFRILHADFVTVEDGTGIVHLAPAFGSDDYEVFKQEGVPFIQHVKMNGTFTDDVTDFAGLNVKPLDDHMSTDIEIIKWLAHNGKLFAKKKYEHSYPHCWRCDTPLLNYATSSWFINVTEIKEDALKQAKNINWSPAHVKEGRFGKWLENARDWSISRQRFWASVMPIWECTSGDKKCDYVVVGSAKELEDLSGETFDDLHKHTMDKITFDCKSCGKEMNRVPDVLDTWFDSGSMPYAQSHYPFNNEDKFDAGFPAEFIAEGQDQTRAWFYYLHVIGTGVKKKNAFQNVIVNGIVLAEDGKKMSKKLQNYPDPMKMVDTYGADALRYYLLSSPVMAMESLNFSEAGVREVFNKNMNTLSNVVSFYEMFKDGEKANSSDNVLDKWIKARLHQLIEKVTEETKAYKLAEATRPIQEFILDLSQWYVRRSRDRFKGEDEEDKAAALGTLEEVLLTLSKVMAPFTPFIAETVYQAAGGKEESVHLDMWPEVEGPWKDEDLIASMVETRKVVEMGMSLRKEEGIRVRQPLGHFFVEHKLDDGLLALVADELNVKEVSSKQSSSGDWVTREDGELVVGLNIHLTDDLKKEGLARELVRAINQMRKEQKLTMHDRGTVTWSSDDQMVKDAFVVHAEEIAKSTRSESLDEGVGETEVEISSTSVKLTVKKA
jgi:isoleucyl-tRNA synthetase